MHIRVINIRKYYKWICVFLSCMICIFSLRILILDIKGMKASASSAYKSKKVLKEDSGSKDLFILFLNKAIPSMEVNYEKKDGKKIYKRLAKNAVGRVLDLEDEEHEIMIEAQVPASKDITRGVAERQNDQSVNKKVAVKNIEKNEEKKIYTRKKDMPTEESIKQKNAAVQTNAKKIEQEAKEKIVKKNKSVKVVSSSVKSPAKLRLDMSKPSIFIYHTHATESYMPEMVGNFHSLNRKYTVRAVGEQLTNHLKKKGYKIVHDETLHDYPSYAKSYITALETLKKTLKEKPSLKVVIDVHRDAAPNSSSARENSYVVIDGKKVAKFSIVVGAGNKNAEKLMIFAEYIKGKSDEKYPGLAKKTITKPYKFNQYNSDYYILIEIGNTANHIDEAIRTTKYVAEIMDQVIKDIKR